MTDNKFHYSPIPIRGFQIDCRAQMMRFEKLVEALEDAARWGYNTLLLEYQDKFPFKGVAQEAVAPDALTRKQIKELARIAKDLGLDIIPVVQCLGHMEWVLRFPHLRRRLAEGWINLKTSEARYRTLCPSHPGSQKLFRETAEQVLEMHPDSRYFHMGGDEGELIETCPLCKDCWQTESVVGILSSYFLESAQWLRAQGPDPIMWCDMPLHYLETLDALRGHVAIMDWDYWSGQKPTSWGRAWGIPANEPKKWPAVHRAVLQPYFFTPEGKVNPFPYIKMLRDRGFPVIIAPSARWGGDSFCVPKAHNVENVIGAAKKAAESHVLGMVVTSWALRLSPWPLTEYSLIAGAMTMQNPAVSRREIDACFAQEHFGVADPKLAQIPLLLGSIGISGLLEASPNDADPETGMYVGRDYNYRLGLARQNPEATRRCIAQLQSALKKVEKLLSLARPKTDRQRYRVQLWQWAIDVFRHYGDFGPQVLVEAGAHDVAQLRRHLKASVALSQKTGKLLHPLLTDRSIESERQTRFGIQLDYINEMIAAAEKK